MKLGHIALVLTTLLFFNLAHATCSTSDPCAKVIAPCPDKPLPAYPPCSPYAILPGFYLGLQGGYSEVYYSPGDLNSTYSLTTINNTGVGGRAFLGYQLNTYWGAEIGFSKFASADVQHLNAQGDSGDIKEQAFDAVLKGSYPLLDSGFNIYAKAGGAVAKRQVAGSLQSSGLASINHNLLFTYGGGATYNLTRHIPIDFSWTRIQHNETITNADLMAVGIAYYFG
ncbi:MAG: hypothetical protein ACD_44C00325G0002 [uncultured bacterium]|nr:MAG: hypothetical protein ACD_44C00325G0002 [uncultured bacterium]OGT16638.1 MAG: hypothetical protein A3B69_03350 [Gammaproteobacteria bacterium RIFCSPHIGHO2_02_FULL_38_33]OGT23731.1 MAG: hypothetical protein A2W47_04770 [Gammaproteobacteria bacterium RIFCSPHIGHO2_12_38_15]OGT67815.1 MAG: hypothetical protein A3I12_01850 [Gammaproteobacteria bacterium RIFCSPLOWO2_02_FULL_38_11]